MGLARAGAIGAVAPRAYRAGNDGAHDCEGHDEEERGNHCDGQLASGPCLPVARHGRCRLCANRGRAAVLREQVRG